MSASTAPAAVPNDPAASTTTPNGLSGLLTSMVAPVEPARPTPAFDLAPSDSNTDRKAEYDTSHTSSRHVATREARPRGVGDDQHGTAGARQGHRNLGQQPEYP